MVFVSPFHDKKDIFRFTWTVHRKNHLPGSNQSVLVEIPTHTVVSLCVVFNQRGCTLLIVYCVLNHTSHYWDTDNLS